MVGYVEYTYLQNMPLERKIEIYRQYLSYEVPCTIFCSLASPDPEFLELAVQFGRPVFYTDQKTSSVMAKVIHWLSIELAPCISIHGVLVDVYGEGILIMGESGIGKSEAALELIKRGHRLVTDDVVEIRRINETELIGTSPEITRHFIELRGIGIIDVKALFGVELSLIHILPMGPDTMCPGRRWRNICTCPGDGCRARNGRNPAVPDGLRACAAAAETPGGWPGASGLRTRRWKRSSGAPTAKTNGNGRERRGW